MEENYLLFLFSKSIIYKINKKYFSKSLCIIKKSRIFAPENKIVIVTTL